MEENMEKNVSEKEIENKSDSYLKNNISAKDNKKRKILIIITIFLFITTIIFTSLFINSRSNYNDLQKEYSSDIAYLNKKNASLKDKNNQQKANIKSLEKNEKTLKENNNGLSKKNKELLDKNNDLESQVDELENGASAMLVKCKNAYESKDWDTTISIASDIHTKYNGSSEDNEAQNYSKKAQDEKNKEEAASKEKEEKGYDTGITYSQLSRTPDDYVGEKIKFTGKVIQVTEDGDAIEIRLAVNGDSNSIILCMFESSITKQRILEDDNITIYGTSLGTITYTAVLGNSITVPSAYVDKIDIN